MCLLNRNLQTLLATVNYYAISSANSYAGTAHHDNYNLLNPIPAVVQAATFTCYMRLNGRNSTWKACITKVVFSGHHENFQFYSNSVFLAFVCNTSHIPIFSIFFLLKMAFSLFPPKLTLKSWGQNMTISSTI